MENFSASQVAFWAFICLLVLLLLGATYRIGAWALGGAIMMLQMIYKVLTWSIEVFFLVIKGWCMYLSEWIEAVTRSNKK